MTKVMVDRIVKYVLSQVGGCPHRQMVDCQRCVAKWVRDGIRKAEATAMLRVGKGEK